MTWEQAEVVAQANFEAIKEEYRQRQISLFPAFPVPEADGAGWWLRVMNEASHGMVHLVARLKYLELEKVKTIQRIDWLMHMNEDQDLDKEKAPGVIFARNQLAGICRESALIEDIRRALAQQVAA